MDALLDLLVPGLAVVFIGEAAAGESARRGEYYADPRNTFWDDLYKSGVTIDFCLHVSGGCSLITVSVSPTS